jgi:site-specific recombinase XerD
MQGRLEHKIQMERKIQEKISDAPEYLMRFYYSLNLKSHTTKFRYISNVLRFLEVYSNGDTNSLSVSDIENIEALDVEQYIAKISIYHNGNKTKEISESTKACIYSSINAFFTFMVKNNYINDNPFSDKKIERPKIPDTEITFLTPEEVKLVENNILHGSGNELAIAKQKNWKFRDVLLFRIPSVTGLRVTALSEINIEDIDLDKKTIKVIEKGNIHKNIYIDEKTIMFIKLWLEQRKKLLNENQCQALFISNRKERMSIRSIEHVIKKYTEDVVDKHITPHKLRSTCGTNLYQAKKDIYLVANVLGHKTTAPTKRYAKIFDKDKRDAISTIAELYN